MWTSKPACNCFLLVATAVSLLVGCKTKSYPQLEYMPDMYRQMSVRAQEYDPHALNNVGMREPVPGTVPRDYEPYRWGFADTVQADAMKNPLPPTREVFEAGRKYFNTFCIVCHGARGDGYGYIIPKFTQPPSLYSDKLMKWTDGRIFHIMTVGQGLMSSYASQLLPEQRWAVVHYIRALQRAAHPSPEDLKLAQKSPIRLESDLPDTGRAQLWPKR